MNQILEVYISKFFTDVKLKNEYLIKNKNNQQMGRDGIEYIVQKYATILKNNDPSFPSKFIPICLDIVKQCTCLQLIFLLSTFEIFGA